MQNTFKFSKNSFIKNPIHKQGIQQIQQRIIFLIASLLFSFLAVAMFSCSSGTASWGDRVNVIEASGEAEVIIADFSKPPSISPISPGWYHRKFFFVNPLTFRFVKKDGRATANLRSDNSASMLYRHIDIDLTDYPYLAWDWMVDKNVESDTPEQEADGDDSAARLFISFVTLDEEYRRMELIWARQLNRHDRKYTHEFNHYVVRGKDDALGTWYEEKLNLKEIYESFWDDGKAARVDVIALFADSEQTGSSSSSYYADIKFLRE